jgi:quercetin dioxygenase-like cupin family protein
VDWLLAQVIDYLRSDVDCFPMVYSGTPT